MKTWMKVSLSISIVLYLTLGWACCSQAETGVVDFDSGKVSWLKAEIVIKEARIKQIQSDQAILQRRFDKCKAIIIEREKDQRLYQQQSLVKDGRIKELQDQIAQARVKMEELAKAQKAEKAEAKKK